MIGFRSNGAGLRLRTVDLFCGAGGSSLGARMAGAEIAGAINSDPLAVATYKANFPEAKAVLGRLNESNGVQLIGNVGSIDLILCVARVHESLRCTGRKRC